MQITVLDFSSGNVYVIPFDNNIYSNDNIQDFFDAVNEQHDLNLKESNCQWMIYKKTTITFLN